MACREYLAMGLRGSLRPEGKRQRKECRGMTDIQCPLNQTELEAVQWLCQGKTPGEIAQIIGAHRNTIARRIHRAYIKTGVYNWHGLVGLAYREGWAR